MRKLYLFMMVTADGNFEGVDHDISWHNVDSEFQAFAIKQLDDTGALIFGSRTYKMMASFWTSEFALEADNKTATRMNSIPKLVFSRKLKSADWNNTKLYKDDLATTINALKRENGKDIAVFGSSNLCVSLLHEGLLDELRLMVNPVALGKGTQLFHGLKNQVKLEKKDSRTFKNGNVLLTYKVLHSK